MTTAVVCVAKDYPANAGFLLDYSLFNRIMQILSTLRRQTKSGISTWDFCRTENDQYFAVGGEDLKLISCTDRKHLREVFENFKGYGYSVVTL